MYAHAEKLLQNKWHGNHRHQIELVLSQIFIFATFVVFLKHLRYLILIIITFFCAESKYFIIKHTQWDNTI